MSESTKAQLFVKNMNWMINSGDEAEAMKTKDLAETLCELDHNHVSSLESAIFGEAFFRLQHPFTWRLRHWCSKIGTKYHTWKYFRSIKCQRR